MRSSIGIAVSLFVFVAGDLAAAESSADAVVATVNGVQITQTELDTAYLIRRIPADRQAQLRDSVLSDLVDRALVTGFLDKRKAPAPESELNAQVGLLETAVEAGGTSLDEVLASLGLTKDRLRAYLSLALRWKAFVRRTVTDQELRDYFASRRAQFDGTKVRVRQIVVSLPNDAPEADWAAAETRLNSVRGSIVDGEISFEDAAREHSTSPSGKLGGELGFVTYRGQLPPDVTAAAFALESGEISKVIRSPFGVHLVQAAEREPGDYSLEDVRDEVWEQRAREFWDEQVARLRETARIKIAPIE